MGLFSNQFLNVVEWQEYRDDILFWKWSNNEIKKDSKLIIKPGQDAIFLYNGKIEGIFSEDGSYDIESQIVPFLSTLKGFKFGFNSGMRAEVVFVNTGDVLEGRFLHSNTISKEGLPGQAKKSICKGDILYSEIRPKNKRYAYVNFETCNYVVSTKFMVINPKSNILGKLLYRILTLQSSVDNFDSIAEGRSGTFPQITFDAISELQIVLPPLEIQNQFQVIVEPMELLQDELFLENQTLTTLRDSLLSKLISGEVRVKDAARSLAEVL